MNGKKKLMSGYSEELDFLGGAKREEYDRKAKIIKEAMNFAMQEDGYEMDIEFLSAKDQEIFLDVLDIALISKKIFDESMKKISDNKLEKNEKMSIKKQMNDVVEKMKKEFLEVEEKWIYEKVQLKSENNSLENRMVVLEIIYIETDPMSLSQLQNNYHAKCIFFNDGGIEEATLPLGVLKRI